MQAIDISAINQMDAVNKKAFANEKLSKAEFIALAAALGNDFYDLHRENEGEENAHSLIEAFTDFCASMRDLNKDC
jgi:quinol monooxygenase YgiN